MIDWISHGSQASDDGDGDGDGRVSLTDAILAASGAPSLTSQSAISSIRGIGRFLAVCRSQTPYSFSSGLYNLDFS